MFSRAAFVSASRAATRPSVTNPADLDLSGPGCGYPVEPGDGAQGFDHAPVDPSVSLAPRERAVIGTAELPSRSARDGPIGLCCQRCPRRGSHIRSYGGDVAPELAPRITAEPGAKVSPMSAEDVFHAFLSSVELLGTMAVSSVSAQPAVRWSYAKLVKAAAASWRAVRGSRAVFDLEWVPRLWVLW